MTDEDKKQPNQDSLRHSTEEAERFSNKGAEMVATTSTADDYDPGDSSVSAAPEED